MHPLRVGGSERKSLVGTIVDVIIKIGRWKSDKVGNFSIGSATRTRIQLSTRKRDHACATDRERVATATSGRVSSLCVRADVRLYVT